MPSPDPRLSAARRSSRSRCGPRGISRPPRPRAAASGHGARVIDLQVNGAGGYDLTIEPEAVWKVGDELTQFGVTAFLPTLVSPPWEIVHRAQEAILAGPPNDYQGATPLGWHVEGPFLNPKRAGAHDPGTLRYPTVEAVAEWS